MYGKVHFAQLALIIMVFLASSFSSLVLKAELVGITLNRGLSRLLSKWLRAQSPKAKI